MYASPTNRGWFRVILVYTDCSYDDPLMSVGYIILRSTDGNEQLLDTGTRLLHTESSMTGVRWTSHSGEYYAAIVGVRAALEYTDEEITVNLDNSDVVRDIKNRTWDGEDYFPHALFSFLPRFEDYHVRIVHRKQNEKAHEQARLGLKVGREMQEGVV